MSDDAADAATGDATQLHTGAEDPQCVRGPGDAPPLPADVSDGLGAHLATDTSQRVDGVTDTRSVGSADVMPQQAATAISP